MRPEELEDRLGFGPLLLDGGLGALFIAQGLKPGEAPERWVGDRPEAVMEAHRAYADAGSDLIHTVTFGGTPAKLAAAGMPGTCAELDRSAVDLARRAWDGRVLVAGDIGPTGLLFPPMGEATAEQLEGEFREQADVLAEAGVDLLSIETMYDLREAEAAVRAACATGLPVLACMTFEKRRRGFFTLVGDRVGPAMTRLRDAGATAVGFNCSVTSGPMIELVKEAAAAVDIPLIAQPNGGQPRPTPDGVVYDIDSAELVADLLAALAAGAAAVGGCCGTTPEHIAAVRAALSERGAASGSVD